MLISTIFMSDDIYMVPHPKNKYDITMVVFDATDWIPHKYPWLHYFHPVSKKKTMEHTKKNHISPSSFAQKAWLCYGTVIYQIVILWYLECYVYFIHISDIYIVPPVSKIHFNAMRQNWHYHGVCPNVVPWCIDTDVLWYIEWLSRKY